MTLLDREVIQLPVSLERETLIKYGFDQLGKQSRRTNLESMEILVLFRFSCGCFC